MVVRFQAQKAPVRLWMGIAQGLAFSPIQASQALHPCGE